MRHRSWICAAAVLLLPGLVQAESLTFTEQFVANFDFQLLGGTVINPGPTTPFIPFEAMGGLTFVLDPSINDPTKTTVPFTSVTGTLTGVLPAGFLPYTISPDLRFLGGELTNIVRDSSGNLISANVTDLSMKVGPGVSLTDALHPGRPALRRSDHFASFCSRHRSLWTGAFRCVSPGRTGYASRSR